MTLKTLNFAVFCGIILMAISCSDSKDDELIQTKNNPDNSADPISDPSPEHWTEPRLYHGPFQFEFDQRIRLARVEVEESPKMTTGPNGAYWYSANRPDTTQPGPWACRIHIFNERDYLLAVELLDVNQYEVKVTWINEKLLHIRVWWGRVLATDLILDVEAERFLFKEMVHDGQVAFEQAQRAK